ncbi:MAG: hypothetical protein AB1782_16470 [Cyanobacteriota bacterium]
MAFTFLFLNILNCLYIPGERLDFFSNSLMNENRLVTLPDEWTK